jgi:hypothetical protein
LNAKTQGEKKMNKKMIIAVAIIQVILIGSLLAIASDNDQNNFNNYEVNDSCPAACGDCDGTCDGTGYCNFEGGVNCDGTGICSENQQQIKSCDSACDGSGSGGQARLSRNCYRESSCSGICNN